MKRRFPTRLTIVEREANDDVNLWYHFGRLIKAVALALLLLILISAVIPETYDFIDSIHPVTQVWIFLCLCAVSGYYLLIGRKK